MPGVAERDATVPAIGAGDPPLLPRHPALPRGGHVAIVRLEALRPHPVHPCLAVVHPGLVALVAGGSRDAPRGRCREKDSRQDDSGQRGA
jgi:hypothetical protein